MPYQLNCIEFRLLEKLSSGHMLKASWRCLPFILLSFEYPVSEASSNQRINMQSEIMSKPELFVEPDPELPLALLDQKEVYIIHIL